MSSVRRLKQEWKELQNSIADGISAKPSDENYLVWECSITAPPGSYYAGGTFEAKLEFPEDYPLNPPKMTMISIIHHPNIYPKTGEVCISILHPPGDDPFGHETAKERWNSSLGVENILLSVMHILVEPNPLSPANVEAGSLFRNEIDKFVKRAKLDAERAKWKKTRKDQDEAYYRNLAIDIKKDESKLNSGVKRSLDGVIKNDNIGKESETCGGSGVKTMKVEKGLNTLDAVIKSEDTIEGSAKSISVVTCDDVPAEPSKDCELKTCTIRFLIRKDESLDNYPTISRRFYMSDKVEYLLKFLRSKGFESSRFNLLVGYPQKNLIKEDPQVTLQDLGFTPLETVRVFSIDPN